MQNSYMLYKIEIIDAKFVHSPQYYVRFSNLMCEISRRAPLTLSLLQCKRKVVGHPDMSDVLTLAQNVGHDVRGKSMK